MARVLIGEPHPEVRRLLSAIVNRLGHEAIGFDDLWRIQPPHGDALVLEPQLDDAVELVHALRRRSPELRIVCASSYAPTPAVLALEPVACLVKPFPLAELALAVEEALAEAPFAVAA